MGIFNARFTDDGSVGLFSDEYDDIYHSCFGALSEAYEKFILPADFNNFFDNHTEIKILDICYGIGYNSKSFLNYYFYKFFNKNLKIKKKNAKNNLYINSIDTDNIFQKKIPKLTLHAVEIDDKLIKLSPFIKQSKIKSKKIKKNNLFSCLNRKDYKKFYINDIVNIILFLNLIEKYKHDFFNNETCQILFDKAYKKFFNQNMVILSKMNSYCRYNLSLLERFQALLHNIYYKYISNSYKNAIKILKNNDFNIKLFNQDARLFIKDANIKYNYIFLDAFSPNKAPNLWTVEFFKELYCHLSNDGMILTYSNSSAIRNAFVKNNFYVGKIYNEYEKRFTGTVATKDKSLIKYPLTDFELGLLNTKSAICYHDNINLTLDNSVIKNNRENEINNSTLISTSQFKKEYK